MRDAKLAVETGVDGLDVVIGTSSFLREHSHGKDMAYIEKTAVEVIEYVKSKGLEVRCKFYMPRFAYSPKHPFPLAVSGKTLFDTETGRFLGTEPAPARCLPRIGGRRLAGNGTPC